MRPLPLNIKRPTIYGVNGALPLPDAPDEGLRAQEAAAAGLERLQAQGGPPPQDPAAQPAPARRPGPPRSGAPSRRAQIIDDVLSGYTVSTARERANARERAQQDEADRLDYAQTIEDPLERELFLTQPEAWSKMMLDQRETRVVGHGDVISRPYAQEQFEIPPITAYDQASMDQRQATADARAEQQAAAQAERERHNRAQEGIGQGRLGVSQSSLADRRSRRPAPRAAGARSAAPAGRAGPTAAPPPPPGYVPVR